MSVKEAASGNRTGLILYGELICYNSFFDSFICRVKKRTGSSKYCLTNLFALMHSKFLFEDLHGYGILDGGSYVTPILFHNQTFPQTC